MKPRIVLVDDQPAYRELVCELVSDHVEVVAQAGNADEALAAVGEYEPDGVVIDVNLDGGHAFRLAKELAEKKPRLKILLISAYAERVYEEIAGRIPRAAFLAKADVTGEWLADYFAPTESACT